MRYINPLFFSFQPDGFVAALSSTKDIACVAAALCRLCLAKKLWWK
jgi:hypothetical protein